MLLDLKVWPPRRWLAAVAGAVLTALLIGVPTAVVSTPFFTRMTSVTWWNWPVWIATAVLGGLVLATYVRTADHVSHPTGRLASGGLLSALAVGCPICNKLVVALVGISGALQWWAPLQPLLGVASIVLLGYALHSRLRGERACRVRDSRAAPATDAVAMVGRST